jgi:hypothetical protein
MEGALLPTWRKPTSQAVTQSTQQSNYLLAHEDTADNFSKFQIVDLNYFQGKLLIPAISKVAEKSVPDCIYWKYDEANLLPAKIHLSTFTEKPDTCLPLKHMFQLSGIEDVSSAINKARANSKHGFRNLLQKISRKSTKHLKNVWKEYKKIEIRLLPNGDTHIDAGVSDDPNSNVYEMQKRSDGFKRFISFLLMISARVETNELENTILLIDEPEIGLHPSGARYLRDELLTISKNNYVIYSTHSTNMIDRSLVKRHYIVNKDKEITRIQEADESNLIDEEVLYNALGTSTFEVLKEDNIIFEGWRDQHLFDVAMLKLPPSHEELKERFKNVGRCFGQGVKDLKSVTMLIQLANRNCVIVSDSDDVAKQMRREFIESKSYGEWFCYTDLLDGSVVTTEEDFILPEIIASAFNKIRTTYPIVPECSPRDFVADSARLNAVKNLLRKVQLNGEQIKDFISSLKDVIFNDLKPSQIEPRYYSFLSRLAKSLGENK